MLPNAASFLPPAYAAVVQQHFSSVLTAAAMVVEGARGAASGGHAACIAHGIDAVTLRVEVCVCVCGLFRVCWCVF